MQRILFILLLLSPVPGMNSKLFAGDVDVPLYRLSGEELQLKGSWLFFPGKFLSPSDVGHWSLLPHQLIAMPQSLPGPVNDPGLPGWGTLMIRLQNLDALDEDLGLLIRADTAFHVYISNPMGDGRFKPILAVGKPASTPEESLPENVSRIGVIHKADLGPEVLLVMHISGWHFHSSSVWTIPRILPLAKAQRFDDGTRFLETLTLGTLVTMALYFFSFTLRRKDDTSAFWLATLSVFTATRLILTSGTLLNLAGLAPNLIVYSLFRKLEFASIPALGFAGLTFVVQCFGETRFQRLMKYNRWMAGVLNALCLVTAAPHLHSLLPLLNGYLLFQFFLGIYISLSAIKTNTSATIAFTLGLTINLLTAIHDIALGSGATWTSGYFLSPFGVAALIFSQGQILAINFDKAYSLAARLSRELRQEVERQTAEVKTIMNTIPQGILTISPSGQIAPGLSTQVKTILHREDIVGEVWSSVLLENADISQDQKQISMETMKLVLNENLMNFEVNQDNFPSKFDLIDGPAKGACLELTWNPLLGKKNMVEGILVTIFDATQKKILEMEAQKNEHEIRLVRELVAIPLDRYQAFNETAQVMLAELAFLMTSTASLETEDIRKIYLTSHTLKGASRTLGLQHLANSLHEIETAIEALRKNPGVMELDENLRKNYASMVATFNDYQNVNDNLLGRVKQDFGKIQVSKSLLESCSASLSRMEDAQARDLLGQLVRLTHVPLRELLLEATDDLKKIAKDLGKPCPESSLSGDPLFLSSKAANAIRKALVHLLRNSMDHGIESVEQRLRKGKSAEGHMSFVWTVLDEGIRLRIADDGQGLALTEVLKKGLEQGILSDQDRFDRAKLINLIFHPNFSTAPKVTQFSGRGIGMNAVRSYIEEIGGRVEAQLFDPGQVDDYAAFYVQLQIPLEHCRILPTAQDSISSS